MNKWLAFKIGRAFFVMIMPDTEFVIIGKILSADLDAEGHLHLTLKNSSPFWAEIAANRLRQSKNQIIQATIREWKQTK